MTEFVESAWPPTELAELLGRPHFRQNLDSLLAQLQRGGRDRDLLVDIVQQILFESIERCSQMAAGQTADEHPLSMFSKFASEKYWWHYLFTASRNRYTKVRSEKTPHSLEGVEVADPPRADGLEVTGTHEILATIATSLSLKQRAVFVLLREGFTQSEISQIMGLSRSRVSQLKEAAVRQIRRLLGQ